MNETRICTDCKVEKPLTDEFFYRHSNKRTGYDKFHGRCKKCKNIYQTAWHRKDPERVKTARINAARYRAQLRAEVVSAYGGKCSCCGESRIVFLVLDHIYGGGNKQRKSLGGDSNGMYRFVKKSGFPKDTYRILCANCNVAFAKLGYCPHKD
jgi:hypothetical protein